MAEHTTNYELIKPEETDPILLGQINENMDKIDAVLAEKVDKSPGKGLSTNDFTDAEKQKLFGLENYDDTGIKSETALNHGTLGYQRKNLLKNTAVSQTKNGVTFTVNEDGSVTASGTATQTFTFLINGWSDGIPDFLKSGELTVSGCPEGGSATSYRISVHQKQGESDSWQQTGADFGNGSTFSFSETVNFGRVVISINSGITLENAIFYPMLRCAEITDGSYEPYKPSIEEQLAEFEFALSTARTEQTVWLGGGSSKTYTLPATARIVEVIFADSSLSAYTYRKIMRYGNNLAVISESKVGTAYDFTQTVADGVLTITASTPYGGALALIY